MNKDADGVATEGQPAWPTALEPLRQLTPARILLGRSGTSLPTHEVLAFGTAHALARDAVHEPLDVTTLSAQISGQDWPPPILVASSATDRAAYLARPDWGRRLDDASRSRLLALNAEPSDIVIVLSDGLSARAVSGHAIGVLTQLVPMVANLDLGPIVIATQARVALADEIGECLRTRLVVNLIGERPGLSTPDSLGIYLTASPRPGRTDAERSCISNIHGRGLGYTAAAGAASRIARRGLQAGTTGVLSGKGMADKEALE